MSSQYIDGDQLTDLEQTQMRLRRLQFGTLFGLLILIPALLTIGARLALCPPSSKCDR